MTLMGSAHIIPTRLPNIIAVKLRTLDDLEEILDRIAEKERFNDGRFQIDETGTKIIKVTVKNGYGGWVDVYEKEYIKLGVWAIWAENNPKEIEFVDSPLEQFDKSLISQAFLDRVKLTV